MDNELDSKLTSTTRGTKIRVERQNGYDSEGESSGEDQVDDSGGE